jgi:hypothetical protein
MKRTHGMSKTRFYGIWNDMMMRCYNPNKERYNCYGARGIKVEKRWHTFINFKEDMYTSYEKWLSLERIRVNGNYSRKNCKWIPIEDQKLNKQKTIRLLVDGTLMTVPEIAKKYDLIPFTIYTRLKSGFSVEECVSKKVKRICNRPNKKPR